MHLETSIRGMSLGLIACLTVACSGAAPSPPLTENQTDAGTTDLLPIDMSISLADAGNDASIKPECQWGGAPGKCMSMAACAAIADHSAEPGSCSPGLSCCIDTPDTADNPPFPRGYKLMMQSQVTKPMTDWAVMILHDPVTYPMYATTTKQFGALLVLAQVEWHPPDFQNGVVHRGVTLFQPM